MLITITFGNENFQRSNSKYQLFGVACGQIGGWDPVQKHLWMLDCQDGLISQHGAQTKVDAAPGYKAEFGKWTTRQYQVPEGLLIKLYGKRKLAEMVSGRETQACMFLQVREGAPLIRVTARLTGDERANSHTITMFEGRADILTLDEAQALGARLPRHQREQFADYNVETLYSVRVLSPETEGRVVPQAREIENTQGERVRVTVPRRRRAIDLG